MNKDFCCRLLLASRWIFQTHISTLFIFAQPCNQKSVLLWNLFQIESFLIKQYLKTSNKKITKLVVTHEIYNCETDEISHEIQQDISMLAK